MEANIRKALDEANHAKHLLLAGWITYDEARKAIEPYLELANKKGSEIAKKYGKRHVKISPSKFLR